MRYFAVIALALGLANAQATCVALAEQFPACPRACIEAAAPKSGCAGGPQDVACLCSKLTSIQVDAIPCVQACEGADIGALLTQATGVCDCVTRGG